MMKITPRLACVLAAFTALLTVPIGTAHASVPGLQRVSASSLNDSVAGKSSTAACPAGASLLGGGARVFPGNGQILVDGITPNSTLGSVRGRAFEDRDGTGLRWQVDSFAICADPLPGLVQVDATSPSSSSDKGLVVGCPPGKQLISAGAETSGGLGLVAIDDVAVSLEFNAVKVFGLEEPGGTNLNWTISAHAICADPVPGLELRTLVSDSRSDNHGVVLACSPGKRLLGLGGEISFGGGAVVMDDLTPNATLTGASIGAREVQGGTTNNWTITGYAICATP